MTVPTKTIIELTGHQIKEMYEFLGGDFDTRVSIGMLGELAPTLHMWITDYHEEGSVELPESES